MDTIVKETTEERNLRVMEEVCRRLRRYRAIDNHLWQNGLGRYSVSAPPGIVQLPAPMIGDVVIQAHGEGFRTGRSGKFSLDESLAALAPAATLPTAQRELFPKNPAPKKRVSKTRKK